MPMFNVKVFQPFYAEQDEEDRVIFEEISNNVIEANSIEEAVQVIAEPLPVISGYTRRTLERDTLELYAGKKGYSVEVIKMLCRKPGKVWKIPSKGKVIVRI